MRGWLFTMARSAAYDIARRPSSRPFLPVEDFQLPPQYDTVDQALTVLTVDQALDQLPSIYADVMRLVRDGLTHSEIAGRLGIPIGTVKSRSAKAADTLRAELASLRGAPMLSERDIELAHPERLRLRVRQPAHGAGVSRSSAISPVAATAGPSWTNTARSARSSSTFPRTSNRQPASKTGRSPPWSQPWPSRRPNPAATRMPGPDAEDRLSPGSTHHLTQLPAEHETRVFAGATARPPQEPQGPGRRSPTLPVWRRHRGRLAAVVAAAAAIVAAAIVVPLSLGGGRTTPAQATVVIPLHVTAAGKASGYGAATGQATARQDASGSWNVTLTVRAPQALRP